MQSPITVAVATRNKPTINSNNRNNHRQNNNGPPTQNPHQWRQNARSNPPAQWLAPTNNNFTDVIWCQLCNKIGHIASVSRSKSHTITLRLKLIMYAVSSLLPTHGLWILELLIISQRNHTIYRNIMAMRMSLWVMDLKMRVPLVRSRNKYGLYEWLKSYPPPPPQAHITSTMASMTTWHRRLGHSHFRILKYILNKFSLPFSERETSLFCNSFSSNKAYRQPFS